MCANSFTWASTSSSQRHSYFVNFCLLLLGPVLSSNLDIQFAAVPLVSL